MAGPNEQMPSNTTRSQQLDGRQLVIAPPRLLDKEKRGSWPSVFGDFQVRQTDFESIGKLENLLQRDVSNHTNVFIDESHRFRTESRQSYEALARICRGKRVILVSATPLNNTPRPCPAWPFLLFFTRYATEVLSGPLLLYLLLPGRALGHATPLGPRAGLLPLPTGGAPPAQAHPA